MEFKEFAKQYFRMCKTYTYCGDCPLYLLRQNIYPQSVCRRMCFENPEESERVVQKWAYEHPIVTNMMKFREVFGRDIRQSAGVTRLAWISGITNDSEKTVNEWLNTEYELPKESE